MALRWMLPAWLSVGAVVVAIAVIGSDESLRAQAPAVRSRHHYGPNIIHERHGTSESSTNWSGYSVDGPAGSVSDVKGSWTVPSATCTSTDAYSAFWVGIDGDNSNAVEQIGTDSDCVGGSPSYYAWYEFYPKWSVTIAEPITPGDFISAEVAAGTKGSFTLTITDHSQSHPGWTYSTSGKVASAKQSSAEWIAEAPWSSGVLPLADFGSVAFGADYTAFSGTCYATVGSSGSQPIGLFWKTPPPGTSAFAIKMVNSSGATKASPSNLSSDGTSFEEFWSQAQ